MDLDNALAHIHHSAANIRAHSEDRSDRNH